MAAAPAGAGGARGGREDPRPSRDAADPGPRPAPPGTGGVRVRCFGVLRERLGAEVLVREPAGTIADLWAIVTRERPELGDHRQGIRAARNLCWCDWDTAVEPGDEVAFMPPVSGGATDPGTAGVHVALVSDPIDLGSLATHLHAPGDGAVAAFAGVVRDASRGRPVLRLDYEAYSEMAERELRRIGREVADRHGVSGLTLVHRRGELRVGEVSVAVIAAAPHRAAALAACAEAIEMVKRDVPIWKREHHPEGAVWVDARELEGGAEGGHGPAAPPPAPEGTSGAGGAVVGTEGEGRRRRGMDPSHGEMTEPALTHVDARGAARMVDVSERPVTARAATAEASVRFSDAAAISALRRGSPKGDVLATARLAGIMAAKRTPELIPLCHPLPLSHVEVSAELDDRLPGVRIQSAARCVASTGVEMEALTAASVAALTVIDMLKSVDPWATVEGVRLREKSGGRSGSVSRPG